MKNLLISLYLLLILGFQLLVFSAFGSTSLPPSDIDYYQHQNSRFTIIFSENFLEDQKKDFIHIYEKLSHYDQIYKKIFYSSLKEKPIYVFSSPRNQTSNAVTSSIPFFRVLFFPTGVEQIYDLSIVNWLDSSAAHEIAHIYQLGQMSDNLRFLRFLFKNSQVIILPIPIGLLLKLLSINFAVPIIPIPIFLNVNITMSDFFLEGHAVLNESLFAPGGRLYSGSTRAMVFSQMKNRFVTTDHFIKNYLINRTTDTFSTEQKYNHGGYFFSSLMDKYNLTHINNIFIQHAEHFIFPFSFISIKEVFQSNFNNSFESLVHYYVQKYLPLALKQKSSPEAVLFKSHICPPFNSQDNHLYFLNSDLKSTPILRTLNLSTGEWKHRRKVFSIGKIFKIQNKYYTSASHVISAREKINGLFSEGMYLLEKYKSQSVQDMYQENWLSIDTTNNMRQFSLLLNGQFYDTTHSQALFGPKGSIYYFKQNGEIRVLHKDKQPLFQFKGFYGNLMFIKQTRAGEPIVYFTGATQTGSSLFAWTKQTGIYRASSSDTIINAAQGPGQQFLVCEVAPEHYVYKMITPEHLPEQPFMYIYSFKKPSTEKPINSMKTQTESQDSPEEEVNLSSSSYSRDLSYHPYHSLKQIQFSGVDLSFTQDPIKQYRTGVNMKFMDPLEYNAIYLSYEHSPENWSIQTAYSNRKHILNWALQHSYRQGIESFFGSRSYSYIHELSQRFSLPVFRKGYWSSSVHFTGAVSYLRLKELSKRRYLFRIKPAWSIQYGRKYYKSFDAHRIFLLRASFQHHSTFSGEDFNSDFHIYSVYSANIGYEFYIKPFVRYQIATKPGSIPFQMFKPLHFSMDSNWNIYLRERLLLETNDYLVGGIQLQKSFETPLYFSRFPLSLRRLSPLVRVQYLQYAKNETLTPGYLEWAAGINMQLLANHKAILHLNLYYGLSHSLTTSITPVLQNLFGIKFHSEF